MANNSDKHWNRPWSMEEIIGNSENWSLAGDVALLNSIKAFADNMLSRTVSLSDNVDGLLNNLNECSLKLDISQNEFQSLRNTQFIESRVYEDDEALDSMQDVKVEPKGPCEEEKEKMVKESILQGLAVVDKYFDKIEVSISDSEEESEKSYVLQAKDLYADRPLPLIIGTEEWYKKWHVGLAESSSESETENVSETYSDSDSEDDLPKDMFKGSESSSELDFSSQASENRPVANSTFNDSVKKPDIFESDEESDEQSDEQSSLPVKTPISNKYFAEQLAAKLGNVISAREDTPEEINRKPIQPAQTSKFVGDLFPDEPPPLNDLEDTILPKNAQSGLFSGGQGLFDDNEDDLFWGQQGTSKKTKLEEDKFFNNTTERETVPTIQDTMKDVTLLPKSSQVSKGLFDSDDSSDGDDIFVANKKQLSKQPFLQPYKTTAPMFDEEPPELRTQKKTTEHVTKKKPVGGVSIFGSSNLFGDQKIGNVLKNQQKNVGDGDNISADPKKPTQASSAKELNVKPKPISLFNDETDNKVITPLAKPEIAARSKKISLFDDEIDNERAPQLTAKSQKISLFDDEVDNNVITPMPKPEVTSRSKKVSLFDDEIDKVVVLLAKSELTAKPKKISLFDDDDDLFKDDLFSNITSKNLTSSLFDDQGKSKDLFGTNIKNNTSQIVKHGIETVTDKNTMEERSLRRPKHLDLFSDNEKVKDIFGKKPNVSVNRENTYVANNNSINNASNKENHNLKTEDVEKNSTEISESLPQRQVIGAEKNVLKGLFDIEGNEDEADDLFKDADAGKIQDKGLFENIPQSGQDSSSSPTRISVKPNSEQPALQVTSPSPIVSTVTRKMQEKSTISLFGSSPPPPDDDDWDTKSDNFSDNEEQFSYRIDDHSGTLSLFDNEPPSLGPNESSGIVGDYNTRVDTDDSSFYPYASSSRRLSSDIYNEQQSQDSFFVTKNKTESISDTPQLGIIPEDTKSSFLDITPSGNLQDLQESTERNPTTENISVFDQNLPNNPNKSLSLFDDDYKSGLDSDDLFSFTNQSTNAPKLSEKGSALFGDLDDIPDCKNVKSEKSSSEKGSPRESKMHNNPHENENVVHEEGSPHQSDLDVKNQVASIAGQLKNEFDKEAPKAPSGLPGKLKHNLNINVNALMPGYAPPKLKDMSKSHSLDLTKEQEVMPTNLSTPDVRFVTPDVPDRSKGLGSSSEKAMSFGDTLDNVEVLHSVTKDRAKIPIKRRPSTRRARQQAIRKSEVDVSMEKEDKVDSMQIDSPDFENKIEENDKVLEIEAVTKDLPAPTVKETPPDFEPKKPESIDIFDDGKDDALFSILPEKAPKVSNKSKNSLFDSADSDSELFGPSDVKKPKTESRSKVKSDTVSKKSLFNDSSSDDDLFSTSSSGKRTEHVAKPVEKKAQKASILRKLENIEAEDDPLSSLWK